jgi:hypothetical protein
VRMVASSFAAVFIRIFPIGFLFWSQLKLKREDTCRSNRLNAPSITAPYGALAVVFLKSNGLPGNGQPERR